MVHILSRIHYPRLSLLILIFAVSYFLLYGQPQSGLHAFLLSMGYAGIFLAGVLYAYGFTAGPAALILLSLAKNENLLAASLVGGVGALIGDLIIFLFIRRTFEAEIERLCKTHIIQAVEKDEERLFGRFQKYVINAFASFLIASPLPTEIGVTLMASRRHLSSRKFALIAYSLHTTAIFLILLVGRAI